MSQVEYSAEYYAKNSDRIKKRTNSYYHRNKEAAKKQRRKHYLANREEILARNKVWKNANKEKKTAADRAGHVKRKYGLSPEDYTSMIELQENKCALCFCDFSSFFGNFHVDHNHTTGKVRGLLCPACNKGLGMFKDNIQVLEKAINYLRLTD